MKEENFIDNSSHMEHYNSRMIKAGVAVEMLAKNGIIVNEEEAKKILELLYFLVKLTVNQLIKDNEL